MNSSALRPYPREGVMDKVCENKFQGCASVLNVTAARLAQQGPIPDGPSERDLLKV